MVLLLKRVTGVVLLAEVVLLLGSAVQGLLRGRRFQRRPVARTAPVTHRIGADLVTVFFYGEDLYEQMLRAIENAEERILLETFIVKDDDVGRAVKEALTEAVGRGVEVYVIYDAFANQVVPAEFKRFPEGVHVVRYPVFPAGWKFYDPRRYGRDHHKLLCVDEELAFVGGYNLGAPYARHWRDTHVAVSGPSSWHLRHAFALSWNNNRKEDQPLLLLDGAETWDPHIRAYRNSARERVFPIRDMYLQALNRAKDRIYLSHAYLVPDRDIRQALHDAAARGVDVRILVPRGSNHPVMDWLSRRSFGELLESGIRLFLYDRMFHAKTATVDGAWSTMGTANIDRMSLLGNYEVNVEVFDRAVAEGMERAFFHDCEQASELTLEGWHRRGPWSRLLEAGVAPLGRVL
jgi:cardiolipin synthase